VAKANRMMRAFKAVMILDPLQDVTC